MATMLYRLGRLAYRKWPFFIAAWLIIIVGSIGLSTSVSKGLQDSFDIPGLPSETAMQLKEELFPTPDADGERFDASIVLAAPEGKKLSDPEYQEPINTLVQRLAEVDQVATTPQPPASPVAMAAATKKQFNDLVAAGQMPQEAADANFKAISPFSDDERIGLVNFAFVADTLPDVKKENQDAVRDLMAQARQSGLTVEANGQGMDVFQQLDSTSELVGLGVAAVILIMTFGSLVAAGMPIVTAIIGVAIGLTLVNAATAFTTVGTSTPTLASMIGLAVGIDYALFILSRYRTELTHTDDRVEAIGLAVGRAGSAVVFAGLTVIIALVALAVVQIPPLTKMGLAAALTVLLAVLIAITLLPAILGLFKSKAFAGRVRADKVASSEQEGIVNGGVRWANNIRKAPLVVGLLITVVLGAIAIPAFDLNLGLPTDETKPADTSARQAADLTVDAFGEGRLAPLLIIVDAREVAPPTQADPAAPPVGGPMAAISEVTQWASGIDNVLNAQVVATNESGNGAQILVTPDGGASSPVTSTVLDTLRTKQADIEKTTNTTVGVTGVTAVQVDLSDRLQSALAPYLAVVVGLATILLMMVFRSILVPLTATLGFLLSVLATLGATVAIFQKGLFGLYEPAPLVSFLPVLVIGIVFGLAMDYQVFLVTRMREAYVHGDTASEAIVDGFRHGARVVTAAAAIMISVFAAFMLQDDPLIQSMGFALAAAVFFDAFLIRLVLIPASMYLLGDKAWALPKWLDRIIPEVDVEGESLTKLTSGRKGSVDPSSPGTPSESA